MFCFDPIVCGFFKVGVDPGGGVKFANHLGMILSVIKARSTLKVSSCTMQRSSI